MLSFSQKCRTAETALKACIAGDGRYGAYSLRGDDVAVRHQHEATFTECSTISQDSNHPDHRTAKRLIGLANCFKAGDPYSSVGRVVDGRAFELWQEDEAV